MFIELEQSRLMPMYAAMMAGESDRKRAARCARKDPNRLVSEGDRPRVGPAPQRHRNDHGV